MGGLAGECGAIREESVRAASGVPEARCSRAPITGEDRSCQGQWPKAAATRKSATRAPKAVGHEPRNLSRMHFRGPSLRPRFRSGAIKSFITA